MLKEIQGFQLSPQQKRLWSVRDNNSAYFAQCAVKIEGDLQSEVLKAAIETAIARHEILRTTFQTIKGFKIPVQAIEDRIIFSFEERNVGSVQSDDEIDRLLEELKQKYTDIEETQPLHVILIKESSSKYLMLISLPAMNADQLTLIDLINEIGRQYATCLDDEQGEDLSLQYADFAQWQNELLESEDTDTGREYWRIQDFSDFEIVDFIDKQTVADWLEFQPKYLKLPICTEITRKIAEITFRRHVSLADFLLACWQTLIWRLSGKSDLTIGVAVNGRKYEELQEALGLFAKYLPLKCHLEDSHNLSDILGQVKTLINDI
jgi:NRPS condensation-like uncharacterized protein